MDSNTERSSLFDEIKTQIQADTDLAWSWHCNIAIPIWDSGAESHEAANRAAAAVMQHLFKVDVTTLSMWGSLEKLWENDKQ